jgi:hypothetical protein
MTSHGAYLSLTDSQMCHRCNRGRRRRLVAKQLESRAVTTTATVTMTMKLTKMKMTTKMTTTKTAAVAMLVRRRLSALV